MRQSKSLPPQQLVQAQKQIQALFLRPVRPAIPGDVPTWLKPWYSHFGSLPPAQQPHEYHFGVKFLEGVSVSYAQEPGLDIFLAIAPPPTFRHFLSSLFEEVPFRLVVTGHFNFLQGVGANITLENPLRLGVIGMYLNDAGGSQYALTCAHVLDKTPNGQPVDSGTARIGKLAYRIPISTADLVNPNDPQPQAPNQVDCALARLTNANQTNTLPGTLGSISGLAAPAAGASVTISNRRKTVNATVITRQADIRVPYHYGWAYFDDLIAVTGEDQVEPGDSGSIVLSAGNAAAGVVMAISGDATTFDNPPQDLGPIVAVSDIQKILNNLTPLTGSALTLV